MSDKLPQSTKVLVKRLRLVAKAMDKKARMTMSEYLGMVELYGEARAHALLMDSARHRAYANTCWQAAARLEEAPVMHVEADNGIVMTGGAKG